MNIRTLMRNEKGSFSIFSVVIILGILMLTGIFINVVIMYLNVSFAKKAMEESVRVRALAVDVPLKEATGIIEVMHTPHTGSNMPSYSRPTELFGGISIPSIASSEYEDAVDYAERIAKVSFIKSTKTSLMKNMKGDDIMNITYDNICYDIQPLPKNESDVTFRCPVKSPRGEIYTIETTVPILGYEDGMNEFIDNLQATPKKVQINNVVFGATIVEPKGFITEGLYRIGLGDRPTTVLYSIAYPQIDKCYGSFCN